MRYSPISDYAIIGDTRTAALVNSQGSLDWLCFPRFDSPAIFLRLLDAEKGGYCLVQPTGSFETRRRYEDETAVLRTEFKTAGGTLTVTDFMAVRRRQAPDPEGRGMDVDAAQRVVRLLRCTGAVECRVEIRITPDYARLRPNLLRRSGTRVVALNPGDNLHVQFPAGCSLGEDGVITGNLHLHDGEETALVLTWSEADREVPEVGMEQVQAHLDETLAYWRKWSEGLNYRGDYAALVRRSAVTLKLLTYEPTGAIVAAPTTSLPEAIGGKRNWDYRYCWLRDSSLTFAALMNVGRFGEAHDFLNFIHRSLPQNAEHFDIMYRIGGGKELTESTLPLAGYRESRPVRIGNGAARQQQLDIYGELMHCMFLYWTHEQVPDPEESFERDFWPVVRSTAEFVARNWNQPGSGMWEMRGKKHRFTHSVAMCWVALDRAIKLARRFRMKHDLGPWEEQKRQIMQAIETSAYHPGKHAYVEYFDGKALDASVLRLPVMGVLDAKSERFANTVAAMEKELMVDGLLYRYSQDETDDGVGGQEGTFTACGYWLVEAYVLQGRGQDAERTFQHIISHANDLGLMAEELNAHNGEQLGNFPQGFTHIGLINAACRIAAAKGQASAFTQRMLEGDIGTEESAA